MSSLTDLIVDRLPRRPYCTDNLERGLIIRPASIAVEKSHLQLNPAYVRHWLVFDVDIPLAAIAWETANLPAPNWIAVNPVNTHAHYGYLLEVPVITAPAGRDKPLRYAAAIESAFRLGLKADPRYSGLVSKNPLHVQWKTWFIHDRAYSLEELADWVTLPKPSRLSEENVGLGRNVTLFDHLRTWAYSMVRTYKSADANQELWARALLHEAEGLNSRFVTPLAFPEVRAVAKSVAKWTWRRFTLEAFSTLQRSRAQKRWGQPRPASVERSAPWERLGVSRRTYYNRKKAGTLPLDCCTDAISDNSGDGASEVRPEH